MDITSALIPFTFNGVCLQEACWIDDVPYFTRKAIGAWLEYKNPQKKVDEIIRKNPHIEQFSVTPRLGATDGKEYFIKVYNPIGLQLITYESHQPKAKAVKIATAHLVYAFMHGDLKPPKDIEKYKLFLQCNEILQLSSGYERGLAVRYITRKAGKHRSTIYRWLQRIEAGETLERKEYPSRGRLYIKDKDIETMTAMIEADPYITGKEIIKRIPGIDCTAIGTVWNIKKQIKEQIEQRVIDRLEGALLN